MAIERTFQSIPEGKRREANQPSFLLSPGWSRGVAWPELLRSKRVLIIAEAGAGKTYECRARCRQLWDEGEPAFFLELATLASSCLRNMLGHDEEARFRTWLSSQSDEATFFLDSIDELKLSRGSFEQALKRLSKEIAGYLGRARIVITTRPVPFDQELVRRWLPIPSLVPKEEAFARIAMGDRMEDDVPDKWRTVALMPLSDEQIMEFAQGQNIEDPSALLEDFRRRNAIDFARRPQDLLELCTDWHQSTRIRTHHQQVDANVRIKLQSSTDRDEPAELSIDKAMDGASRLALAMAMTRRLTIRHSAEADVSDEDQALDPAMMLSDWEPQEIKTLLERPLFGFASYGRVRFHHRSVMDYLASQRILALRDHSMPVRALQRLIFAQTRGKTIVRPSKRPIAGWLALREASVFETLRDHEPAVLLTEGDPASLTIGQRRQAVRFYVNRHGRGGWRGLEVPAIQVHRFASPELADEIIDLWQGGIENPEVRQTLLCLIGEGRVKSCADIAYGVALDPSEPTQGRLAALHALFALEDERLDDLVADTVEKPDRWPGPLTRDLVLHLFPTRLTVQQLCRILAHDDENKRSIGSLVWYLPRHLSNANLGVLDLEALRDGLMKLVSTGLRWDQRQSEIVSDRTELSSGLAAICLHGLTPNATDKWLRACVLALRLSHQGHRDDDVFKALRRKMFELPASVNERLFWVTDAVIQSLHIIDEPFDLLKELMPPDGEVELNPSRDLPWVKGLLRDARRPQPDRAMLLEAAIQLTPTNEQWRDHLLGLKSLVTDKPELTLRIDQCLKAKSKHERDRKRWQKEQVQREQQQERRQAKKSAQWILFRRELVERPDDAFSADRSSETAWQLWNAMPREDKDSGWNWRFIEEHFNKGTADRLRQTLNKDLA